MDKGVREEHRLGDDLGRSTWSSYQDSQEYLISEEERLFP
jgi:hypothetical protein